MNGLVSAIGEDVWLQILSMLKTTDGVRLCWTCKYLNRFISKENRTAKYLMKIIDNPIRLVLEYQYYFGTLRDQFKEIETRCIRFIIACVVGDEKEIFDLNDSIEDDARVIALVAACQVSGSPLRCWKEVFDKIEWDLKRAIILVQIEEKGTALESIPGIPQLLGKYPHIHYYIAAQKRDIKLMKKTYESLYEAGTDCDEGAVNECLNAVLISSAKKGHWLECVHAAEDIGYIQEGVFWVDLLFVTLIEYVNFDGKNSPSDAFGGCKRLQDIVEGRPESFARLAITKGSISALKIVMDLINSRNDRTYMLLCALSCGQEEIADYLIEQYGRECFSRRPEGTLEWERVRCAFNEKKRKYFSEMLDNATEKKKSKK